MRCAMNCAIMVKMEIVELSIHNLIVGHIFSYKLNFAHSENWGLWAT
jgi:hypothetical protein